MAQYTAMHNFTSFYSCSQNYTSGLHNMHRVTGSKVSLPEILIIKVFCEIHFCLWLMHEHTGLVRNSDDVYLLTIDLYIKSNIGTCTHVPQYKTGCIHLHMKYLFPTYS